MTTISCNVHTKADTMVFCLPLRTPYCGVNTVEVGDMTIFADEAMLRRLADAINNRLAVIEANAEQVAA